MLELIAKRFKSIPSPVDFWSLRLVEDRRQRLGVRQDVLQPITHRHGLGACITVMDQGGLGYAATSDLSATGLAEAFRRATAWAKRTANTRLLSPEHITWPHQSGHYRTPVEQSWESLNLGAKIELLQDTCRRLKITDAIVDWSAALSYQASEVLFLTSAGAEITQSFYYLMPELKAVANAGSETQIRSYGDDHARQGGLEHLDRLGFFDAPKRVAEEALQLLLAPNCPSGRMELLLLPEQMMLQIHESIGHPLELDRILGDERNYAGSSFVTLDMFGTYPYGSALLNVTFDPRCATQLASYRFDDEGSLAEHAYVIKKGILKRPLGGVISQNRANLSGVANARACDWNRPPIDRMANLNLEPGDSTLEQLISQVEYGVLMDTNRSWSIDDSRNKFQFGCEYGRLIRNGELGAVVKNPNYRGVSATFWRALSGVGDAGTVELMGTLNCGKGEPNQAIYVGHASPACLFSAVDVFGGV